MSSQIYDTPVCLWINDKYRDNINHIPFKKRSYSKGLYIIKKYKEYI